MLTRLVKPPKDAAQALKALNISAKNSDGTMKPLSQTLQELRKKFSKLSDSQKSSYAASIAGQEAMSGMLAIVNASDSDFEKLTASINNADGASKQMADTMNDNVKGAFTLLKSNIESVGIKIYDKIKEPLKKLINEVSKYVSKIPTLLKNVYNWVNKNKDVIKKLIIIVASLTAGFLAYQKVLSVIKAINIIKNFSNLLNPIGMATAGIVALTAAFIGLQVAHFNEIASLNGLKKEVENQKKSWEQLQQTRQNNLDSSMTEIGICEKLKNELMQITDENGNVKAGYEDRAKVILDTLNGALGTEYQLNGNIIEQYQELKSNIDEVIAKKKAEAVLTAYQEEYGAAIKEQSKATETLIGLKQQQAEASKKLVTGTYEERVEARNTINQLSGEIKTQTDLISSYGKTIQDYENLQKASAEGSKEAITGAINEIGISYDTLKETAGKSTIEQINAQQKYVDAIKSSLQEAKDRHDEYQQQILQNQLTTNEEQLTNLRNSLSQQTNTVKELTPEQTEAWKEIANRSVVEYSQLLAQVPEETQKEIEKATGIVGQDVGFYRATETTATNATIMFRDNLQLDNMANNEIQGASTAINNDTSVNLASEKLGQSANDGFNNKVDGKKWGADLSENISNGMQSQESKTKITGAATLIGGWIKGIIGHSVPKQGPLKDELTYMPDMIDNLVKGIEKNKHKVVKATSELAQDMKNSFEIQKINDEIYRKMQNAVARENASIAAKATLEVNKSQPTIIARDHTTTINNTQQFYSKESTPYEEQKQAKQQLRRLAYGL